MGILFVIRLLHEILVVRHDGRLVFSNSVRPPKAVLIPVLSLRPALLRCDWVKLLNVDEGSRLRMRGAWELARGTPVFHLNGTELYAYPASCGLNTLIDIASPCISFTLLRENSSVGLRPSVISELYFAMGALQ